VARVGDGRFLYRILANIHESKRPFGKHRSRWDGNTNMHLQATGWSVEWINLAQGPDLVKNVMKLRVAEN